MIISLSSSRLRDYCCRKSSRNSPNYSRDFFPTSLLRIKINDEIKNLRFDRLLVIVMRTFYNNKQFFKKSRDTFKYVDICN